MSFLLAAAADAKEVAEVVVGDPTAWTYIRGTIAAIFMSIGVVFVFAGSLGTLRLPDFYTRLHAAGMTDTMGAEFVLIGLMIMSGFTLLTLKLALVAFFLLITSPTATHAIAHAAYTANLEPLLGKWSAPTVSDIEAKMERDA